MINVSNKLKSTWIKFAYYVTFNVETGQTGRDRRVRKGSKKPEQHVRKR